MWGSITHATTSDLCTTCLHTDTCRAAVKALQPVLCEDQPARIKRYAGRMPGPQRLFMPGELFTSEDVVKRTHHGLSQSRDWLRRYTQAGMLEQVAPYDGRNPAMYRLA